MKKAPAANTTCIEGMMQRLLISLVLGATAMPAVAEVEVCTNARSSIGCYRGEVQADLRKMVPDARVDEWANLGVANDGRPQVSVVLSASSATIAAPTYQTAYSRTFPTDVANLVCGVRDGYGLTPTSEHKFVEAGGVVVYSLVLFSHSGPTVTIDHCEAS